MPTRIVQSFFYGSFMNAGVLARAGVCPRQPRRARLDGWDIRIAPRATLVPSDRACVYGILAGVTHAELATLYEKDWFGFGVYLPEAVLVDEGGGRFVAALCYVAREMAAGTPTPEYLDKLVVTATEFEFPSWYLERIRSFAD
jgi:hypothetical protein